MKKLDELRERVILKKAEIEKRLEELEAKGGEKSRDEIGELESKLNQLHAYLKDGWDNVGEDIANLLEDWIEQ
jgi:hypothetical protein